MLSFATNKLKKKHKKEKMANSIFDLKKKNSHIFKQIVHSMEKKQRHLRLFDKNNFKIILEIFKKYLFFVFHVCTAQDELKMGKALSYTKWMITALKYNFNYFGKKYLNLYYKLNFLLICLTFNHRMESKSKPSEQQQLEFALAFEYFIIYQIWEKNLNEYTMKAILSVVIEINSKFNKIISENFSSKIEKSLKFYEKYSKTKDLPNSDYLKTEISSKNDRVKYFEKSLKTIFSSPENFLDPEGIHKQLLKE